MVLLAVLVLQLWLLFLTSRQVQMLMSGLFLRLTRRQKPAIWLMALMFLPGTLIHELAHYLVARLLLVRAGGLSLWPHLQSDRVVMGHVMVPKVDPLRMFIIGLAPFIVGLSILGLIFWQGYTYQWWTLAWYWQAVIGYIIFQVANNLFLSGADLRQMIRLVVLVMVLAGLAYLIGYRPDIEQGLRMLNQYQDLLGLACLVLLAPLALNLICIAAMLVINRLSSR